MINNINKIKFKTTPYHYNLLKDTERLYALYEAISHVKGDLLYDLGTGCGVLSYFAANNFEKIIAIEKNYKSYLSAKENLKEFNNITVVNDDVLSFKFNEKADYIICEMLDTGLIDEEQILVLNNAIDYLKDINNIIPKGVINILEPILMENASLVYEDVDNNYLKYEVIGDSKILNIIYFKNKIKKEISEEITFTISKNSNFNALKFTTITIITDNLVCGPTPMLNPPLFIPLNNEVSVVKNSKIMIYLSYIMGGGLDTIKTKINEIY